MNFEEDILLNEFGIGKEIIAISERTQEDLREDFFLIDKVKEYNQYKVIKAMQNNKLSDTHFNGTTGYGYDDRGREVLDLVYKDVFKSEDALVRHQIVSGTHALSLCLFGLLRPGDEFLSITGKPYDTLDEVIGIRGTGNGSLKDFGINFKQIDLTCENEIDKNLIEKSINNNTKLIFIQRSKGYSLRPSIDINKMYSIIQYVKSIKNDILVLVDNCYGEFVEEKEPIEVGADIIAGSLIKNPGGGIAPTGGYIAGKKEYIEKIAYRLTAPGIGKKVGASLGHNRLMFQGLFLAPHIVSESLKGAIFCSKMAKHFGFTTSPSAEEKRSDIIQGIIFNNKDSLITFCQGIQKASAVDSFVVPEPWDMPGYDSKVIMAAGAFIQGSSIELSADAPIKEPYIAYMQGGLVFEHVKLGVLCAFQRMIDKGIIKN